jgi:hypothetical protein
MIPPGDLLTLPSSARASIHASQASFIAADRGHVQKRNDATFDSRARHFTAWLEATGFTVDNLKLVDPSTFSSLLAAYLHAVAAGNNLLKILTIGPDALRGYMTSACDALTLLTNKPCLYIDPAALEFKHPKTLPILGDIIGQRTAWKEPRPRKEPFTLAMIDAIRDYLHGQTRQYPIHKVFPTPRTIGFGWVHLPARVFLNMSKPVPPRILELANATPAFLILLLPAPGRISLWPSYKPISFSTARPRLLWTANSAF